LLIQAKAAALMITMLGGVDGVGGVGGVRSNFREGSEVISEEGSEVGGS